MTQEQIFNNSAGIMEYIVLGSCAAVAVGLLYVIVHMLSSSED